MISTGAVTEMKELASFCSWAGQFESSHTSERSEPLHDKTNKMTVHPAKTQISLGIRPVWSESSLGAHAILLVLSWGCSFTHDIGKMHQTKKSNTQKSALIILNFNNVILPYTYVQKMQMEWQTV